jgi:hypothetical protein
MRNASANTLCAAIFCLIAFGCHSEPKDSNTEGSRPAEGAASAKKQDKLAQALASAIEPNGAAKAPTNGDSAPPADGVLDPSKADALAAAHAPPKLSLGSTGSEPRVKLVHRPSSAPLRASLQLAIDLGNGQGMPPVDFKLEVRPSAASNAAVQNLSARVVSADIAMPNLPEELKTQLHKLKGTKFTFKVAESGGAFDGALDASGPKNPEFTELIEMVAQGLVDAYLPLPSESVGAGGYWLVTSRQRMFEMDWITYDMVKVAEVTQTGAKLEISTRRYVVGHEVPTAVQSEGGGKLTIREAMATGNAQATVAVTSNVLSKYERQNSVRIIMAGEDNNGQRVLQAGGQSKFSAER